MKKSERIRVSDPNDTLLRSIANSRRGNGLLKTESEIAATLGEKERTIRSWRHSGVIPCVVIGHRTVRFRLPDVIRALEKRTVKEVA